LPCFKAPVIVKAEDAAILSRFGITLEGEAGTNNVFVIDEAQPEVSLTCRLRGCTGTSVILGLGKSFRGRFAFNGQGSLLISAGFAVMGQPSQINLTLGSGCAAYLGAGVTSVSSGWIIEGIATSLIIGDDFMASWGISARNYDSHALFDIESGHIINTPQSLRIGPHCWVGQDARIIRGVQVGPGAVIGAGALVNADVPASTVVAGTPAKVVRSGVTWARSPNPSAAEINRIKTRLAEYM